MQEELVNEDPVWKKNVDSIGYNFKFTPDMQYDSRGNVLLPFPEIGTYEILFELHMKAGKGNPICWYRMLNVV